MNKVILVGCMLVYILMGTLSVSAQWQQTNGPYGNAINCLAVSGPNILAGTSGDGIYISSDSGASWVIANGLSDSDNYVTSFSLNGTTIFAGTDNGGVFLSTDSGKNWTAFNSGLTNTAIFSLATSGTNIFAGTYGGGVFLSSNNGGSWTSVNNGLTNLYVSSLVANGTNIFAGTIGGGIFLTTNSGASWTAVNNGLPFDPSDTEFYAINSFAVSGTTIFAGINGGVFLSTDNGLSWNPSDNGLPGANAYSFAESGTDIFAAVFGYGVYLSVDSGQSWTAFNKGFEDSTYVNSLVVNGTNIYAGTGSYINTVWKRSLSGILAVENITADNNGISIYPNPATSQVTIHTSSFHNEAETVSILNMLGQQTSPLTSLTPSPSPLGEGSATIDLSGLCSGIYFVEVVCEKERWVGKFVKE